MGLLDDLYQQAGAGPWNALYPSPLSSGGGQGPFNPVAAAGRPAVASSTPVAIAQPDGMIPVGNYQMPQFGTAWPQSAASSLQPSTDDLAGLVDRLSAGLASVAHSRGLFPSLLNGIRESPAAKGRIPMRLPRT